MTTRIYYLPKDQIGKSILNRMVEFVGCSIGDISFNNVASVMKVPVTCNDADVPRIESILRVCYLTAE